MLSGIIGSDDNDTKLEDKRTYLQIRRQQQSPLQEVAAVWSRARLDAVFWPPRSTQEQ